MNEMDDTPKDEDDFFVSRRSIARGLASLRAIRASRGSH